MARHDQKPEPADWICYNCKNGACEVCVDTLRKRYSDTRICVCPRQDHKEKVAKA